MPFTYKEIPENETGTEKSRRENREMRVRADYEDMTKDALKAINIEKPDDFRLAVRDLEKILVSTSKGSRPDFDPKLKGCMERIYELYMQKDYNTQEPVRYVESPDNDLEYQEIIKEQIQIKIADFNSFTPEQEQQYITNQKAARDQAAQHQQIMAKGESRRTGPRYVETYEQALARMQREFQEEELQRRRQEDAESRNGLSLLAWMLAPRDNTQQLTQAVSQLIANLSAQEAENLFYGLRESETTVRSEDPSFFQHRSNNDIRNYYITRSVKIQLTNGLIIKSEDRSRTVVTINTESGEELHSISLGRERYISCMTELHDENIAMGSPMQQGVIGIFNPNTGEIIREISQHGHGVSSIIELANGNIAVGSHEVGGGVKIIDLESGALIRQIDTGDSKVNGLAQLQEILRQALLEERLRPP